MNRADWTRWIAAIPAAVAGWWLVVFAAIALHGLAFSFCPPDDVVSGACVAPWFSRFETGLVYASVALSAVLVVVLPAVVVPAHRALIAWIAYIAGAVVAVSIGRSATHIVVALAAGLVAAVVVSKVYARSAA